MLETPLAAMPICWKLNICDVTRSIHVYLAFIGVRTGGHDLRLQDARLHVHRGFDGVRGGHHHAGASPLLTRICIRSDTPMQNDSSSASATHGRRRNLGQLAD